MKNESEFRRDTSLNPQTGGIKKRKRKKKKKKMKNELLLLVSKVNNVDTYLSGAL